MNLSWNEVVDELFLFLNQEQNSRIILIVFIVLALLELLVKIVLAVGYQSQFAFFKMNAKDLTSRSEIKSGKMRKSSMLAKAIQDYVRIGEKGVASIDTRSVVSKYILRLNVLGWSYSSIEHFIHNYEKNIVYIGILLSLIFSEYRFAFTAATVLVFICILVFGGIFDFRLVRERLTEEMVEYINREIGQFYAGDASSVLNRLKGDLTAAILRQSEGLSTAVMAMGTDLTGAVRLTLGELSKSVERTMDKVADYSALFKEPLEKWQEVIGQAAKAQQSMNTAQEGLQEAVRDFRQIAGSLHEGIAVYCKTTAEQTEILTGKTADLSVLARELAEAGGRNTAENAAIQNAMQKQLQYIEENQTLLEQSLQHYETSLEGIAEKSGEGLGRIVEFHMQQAYASLNEQLQDNIGQIINSNNALTERLQLLFEQMGRQSMTETQAILAVKEQMDMRFDALAEAHGKK